MSKGPSEWGPYREARGHTTFTLLPFCNPFHSSATSVSSPSFKSFTLSSKMKHGNGNTARISLVRSRYVRSPKADNWGTPLIRLCSKFSNTHFVTEGANTQKLSSVAWAPRISPAKVLDRHLKVIHPSFCWVSQICSRTPGHPVSCTWSSLVETTLQEKKSGSPLQLRGWNYETLGAPETLYCP